MRAMVVLPAVLLGQQVQKVKGLAAVYCGHQAAVCHCQPHGGAGGQRFLVVQHILGNGAVGVVGVFLDGVHAVGTAVAGGQVVPHRPVGGKGQPALGAHLLGQSVQLPRSDGVQAFGCEGGGAADVAGQRVHKPRAEPLGQGLGAFGGKEHKVFAAGLQLAHRAGGQRGAHIHQDAPLQHIPAGKRQRAVDGQRGQHVQIGRSAALVMVKGQDLGVRLQRGVQVLQKQLFLRGAGVERKIHRLDPGGGDQPAGGQFLGHAAQGIMAAGALGAAQQHDAAGAGGVRHAHHKGAAEGLDHRAHKLVLAQHAGAHLVRQAHKIAPLFGRRRLLGGVVQQAVLFQRSRQLAAHAADVFHSGVGGAAHRVGRFAGGGAAFLALGGHLVQGALHLLHALGGGVRLPLGGSAGGTH